MIKLNGISAFSLLELMITIAIIGIIAALAVPSYQSNVRKAYFSEIVSVAIPYKMAVVECYKTIGSLKGCNGGAHDIPPDITEPISNIASLAVSDGQITVTPANKHGIESTDTYILTPQPHPSGLMAWKIGGGALKKGYVKE